MIVIAWAGLTQYAACCIEAFIRQVADEEVVVLALRPDYETPFKNLESMLSCRLVWGNVSDDFQGSILTYTGAMPRVFIQSGWFIPSFNAMGREVKKNGGHVIAMVDNDFKFSLKECLKAVYFRLFRRQCFDRYFVTGKSARKLLAFYGVKPSAMQEGMYAANPAIFMNGKPLPQRAKKFLYVGRLNERKNVLRMCEAFTHVYKKYPDWELDVYGNGPLEGKLPVCPGIHFYDFEQPEWLRLRYQEARCLILGSISEHWGVVVHEAALSGCALLLSNRVGARYDLAADENAFIFNPFSTDAFEHAMECVVRMTDVEWHNAQLKSLELAQRFSPEIFAQRLKQLSSF